MPIPEQIPEPSTLALVGSVAIGLGAYAACR
ncbi:MAG: PEP-CTERM sorting domain-containing protein [Rhodopila sp.]